MEACAESYGESGQSRPLSATQSSAPLLCAPPHLASLTRQSAAQPGPLMPDAIAAGMPVPNASKFSASGTLQILEQESINQLGAELQTQLVELERLKHLLQQRDMQIARTGGANSATTVSVAPVISTLAASEVTRQVRRLRTDLEKRISDEKPFSDLHAAVAEERCHIGSHSSAATITPVRSLVAPSVAPVAQDLQGDFGELGTKTPVIDCGSDVQWAPCVRVPVTPVARKGAAEGLACSIQLSGQLSTRQQAPPMPTQSKVSPPTGGSTRKLRGAPPPAMGQSSFPHQADPQWGSPARAGSADRCPQHSATRAVSVERLRLSRCASPPRAIIRARCRSISPPPMQGSHSLPVLAAVPGLSAAATSSVALLSPPIPPPPSMQPPVLLPGGPCSVRGWSTPGRTPPPASAPASGQLLSSRSGSPLPSARLMSPGRRVLVGPFPKVSWAYMEVPEPQPMEVEGAVRCRSPQQQMHAGVHQEAPRERKPVRRAI